MATYGSFPGVRVVSEQGGIQAVSVGLEEKVVLFGEPTYATDDTVDGDASAGELRNINAPREAETLFGAGSELAEGMQEALLNGANIDFLRAMAVPRVDVTGETQGAQTGSLENVEIFEDVSTITADDDGTSLSVEFRYNGAPTAPTESNTVHINPLTGEYAADAAPTNVEFTFDYKHVDYASAFNEPAVANFINEDETGLLFALSDSDAVSTSLGTIVSTLRENYQLVTGFTFGEPNDNLVLESAETTDDNGGAEPRYDTANYDTANQSVSDNAFFKPAPARVSDDPDKTIGGGLAGLYAGKPIDDAVYNEVVQGYSQLEESLNKTEADELRDNDLIPVRSAGSVRVKGNRATNFSDSGSVAADFFTRRITDRVILVVKQIGDAIIGRINNPETRAQAEDAILNQLGSLANDGVIQGNGGDNDGFSVSVYEDSTNNEQVNIDVAFTPFGIVKRVDANVTVNV